MVNIFVVAMSTFLTLDGMFVEYNIYSIVFACARIFRYIPEMCSVLFLNSALKFVGNTYLIPIVIEQDD